MRLRTLGVVVLLVLLLTGVSAAWAQVSITGTIQVIVEDPQGGRLPGVAVTASAPDVVTIRTVVSDAEGVAALEALAPSARYSVKAQLSGFKALDRTDILVRTGQVTTLRLDLTLAGQSETVNVAGQSTPLVDVTRATSGTDITLQLTESLPTGRSYQSYLQLVPGVMPDSTVSGGNPASRSGMNWKDASTTSDNIGGSTDNAYYFEGINVTDPFTGTFGANLNTEIIQEQKVITGGIPAEYVGAAGLISTVITKSGSNDYSGSANYFFRNDGFVAANQHAATKANFNTKETAFTVGGPIMKNSLWGFGSFRYLNTGTDVIATDTLNFLRKSQTINKQGFAKATYAPTQGNLFSFMFLNDPFKRTADTDGSVANTRVRRREQGGNNYSGTYSRVMNSMLIEAAVNYHNAQISDFAGLDTSRNTISFQSTDVRNLADEQLGGFGSNFPETRPTLQMRAGLQKQFGANKLKGGFEWTRHQDHRLLNYTGPDKAQYTSISNRYIPLGGVSAGNISTGGTWSARQFRTSTTSDFSGLITRINSLPDRAAFYALYDTNKDGTISAAEFNTAYIFNSTAGNPDGQINYYRIIQTAEGAQDMEVRGYSFFGQDEISMGRFTFNLGLRGERWAHYATTGAKVFQFPWNIAPRLSAVYDLRGDGRQKASVYWGRYYDPIRMDMTNFAGTATGQVREEQVLVNSQWLSYRVRGGSTIDGFFSPTTKTPYTDELQLQYEADLGNNLSFSAAYYNRKTRDIFEDFDPALYTEPAAFRGNITNPNTLFLGWPYFGWTATNHPAANFFLGTLPGASATMTAWNLWGGSASPTGGSRSCRTATSMPLATRCLTAMRTSPGTSCGSTRARRT